MLAREREKEKEKTKGRDLLLGSVKDKKINPKINKVFFYLFIFLSCSTFRGTGKNKYERGGKRGGGHCGAKQRRRNVSFHLKPLPLPLAASAAASSTSSSATTNSLPIASSNRLA